MVRYHSLVIDPESLPEELIPIAWTSSISTLPFHGCNESKETNVCEVQTKKSIFADSVLAEVENRSSEVSSYYNQTGSGRVLMGIKHSTRPHYGLQVVWGVQKWSFCSLSIVWLIFIFIFVNCVWLSNFDCQFHPESIATCHGTQIFKNFREITYDYWLRFGSSYNRRKYAHSAGNLKNFINTNTLSVHMCLSDWFMLNIIFLI